MMGLAPQVRAPWTEFSPTPPVPITTTLLNGGTLARLTTAPKPVVTPQASSEARSMGKSGSIFTSCDSCTSTYSAKPPTRAFWMISSPFRLASVPVLS